MSPVMSAFWNLTFSFVAGRGRKANCVKFLLSEGKAKREKVVAERL
jgi:hypothetical protein